MRYASPEDVVAVVEAAKDIIDRWPSLKLYCPFGDCEAYGTDSL